MLVMWVFWFQGLQDELPRIRVRSSLDVNIMMEGNSGNLWLLSVQKIAVLNTFHPTQGPVEMYSQHTITARLKMRKAKIFTHWLFILYDIWFVECYRFNFSVFSWSGSTSSPHWASPSRGWRWRPSAAEALWSTTTLSSRSSRERWVKTRSLVSFLRRSGYHGEHVYFENNIVHTVKILGFRQKKLYKGFYAKNVVSYTYEDDI